MSNTKFLDLLSGNTPLLADGAMGTVLHGRGIGFDQCFDELNLHRVQLTVFDYNKRAIALYEKLGFQHEGTFREFLHRDGRRYDMHLYGLLRREWQTS